MAEPNHEDQMEHDGTKTPKSVDDTGDSSVTGGRASGFEAVGRWLKSSSGLRNILILAVLLGAASMHVRGLGTYGLEDKELFGLFGLSLLFAVPLVILARLVVIRASGKASQPSATKNWLNESDLRYWLLLTAISAVLFMLLETRDIWTKDLRLLSLLDRAPKTIDGLELLMIAGVSAVVGLALLLFGRWIVREDMDEDLDDLSGSNVENPVMKAAIRRLRQRSRRLTVAARIVLVAIVMMICAGIIVFVYADAFARSAHVTAMRNQIASIVTDSLRKAFKDAVNEQVAASLARTSPGESAIVEKDPRVQMVIEKASLTFERQTLRSLGEPAWIVLEFQQRLDEKTSDVSKTQLVTADMVSGIATRIGAILLVLFLVQIMVTLYRYNTRLAAFYDARADALELASSLSDMKFDEVVALTSPDTLDFGKAPKTPMQDAVEIAKAIMAQASKTK